jgi:gamma-glutamylaminecyclotransferase
MNNKHLIAVYGTLRKDESNHFYLDNEGAKFIADGIIKGYTMYNLGRFPGIKIGKNQLICELYEVDDKVLADLDRLEGHPTFYTRTSTEFFDIQNNVYKAQTYVFNRDLTNSPYPVIESGDWKKHHEKQKPIK